MCCQKNLNIRKHGITIIFAFLIFNYSFLYGQNPDKEIIRLAAFEYPPFYQEENDEITGIAVDIVNELFSRLNLEYQLKMYPLSRALDNLGNGQSDGLMILIQTEERARFLDFTDPVMTVRGLIWSSVNRPGGAVEFNKLEDLQQYKTGVTRGYSYGQDFDRILKTMNVEIANSDYSNYLKLQAGRIDIFPGNEIVAKGIFSKYPGLKGQFVHADRSFIEWVLRMGISKDSRLTLLVPRINSIINDLKDEGFIEESVKRHTG